ncbi:MAG: cupin domain-containing protein [Victivallaceae bacterium]|nr:cupin domain-containing protein [Victivallaceae bacterium]
MIRKNGGFRTETRERMRSGDGTVTIEHLWEAATELGSDTRMMGRLVLPPGASIGFHRHDGEEEMFFIISGRAEFDDNGVVCEIGPGDTTLTGNGAGHSIRNIGDGDLVVLAVICRYPDSKK